MQSLGITGLSKSQVSEMANGLDGQAEQFRTRPLDAGPYTFVAADALTMKVREDGRVVKVAVLVATGVNAEGYREILGSEVFRTILGDARFSAVPKILETPKGDGDELDRRNLALLRQFAGETA